MSFKIISKRVFALVLGTILAVSAWDVAQIREAASTPAAQLSEVIEPATVSLTIDSLKAMITGAEASKELSETEKKALSVTRIQGFGFLTKPTGSMQRFNRLPKQPRLLLKESKK